MLHYSTHGAVASKSVDSTETTLRKSQIPVFTKLMNITDITFHSSRLFFLNVVKFYESRLWPSNSGGKYANWQTSPSFYTLFVKKKA